MIEPAYVRAMARYNIWQNTQLMHILDGMTADELVLDRGAFFGSIMATINHLLWGDMLWLNRFDPSTPAPQCSGAEGLTMHPTFGSWSAQRFHTDGQIKLWADQIRSVDLRGDLVWDTGPEKPDFSRPIADSIVQFFNHQTHHRGQVHAMLTSAGQDAPVTDIIFMPEEG